MRAQYSAKDVLQRDKEQEALDNLSETTDNLQKQLDEAIKIIHTQLGVISGLGIVYLDSCLNSGVEEFAKSAQAHFVESYLDKITDEVRDVINSRLTSIYGKNFFSPYVDSAYDKFYQKYPSE